MNANDDVENADMGRVTTHVNQLAEHFDTVQIFVTRHEAGIEDGTVSCSDGAGNLYARSGQIREWVIKSDARIKKLVTDEEADG